MEEYCIWIFRYAKQTNNLIYQSCSALHSCVYYGPVRSSRLWFEPYILHTYLGPKKASTSGNPQKLFFPGNNIVWTSKTVPVLNIFSTFLIGYQSVLRQLNKSKNKKYLSKNYFSCIKPLQILAKEAKDFGMAMQNNASASTQ